MARPVDDELGTVSGEAGETGQRACLPLVSAGADGAVKGTDGLEEGTSGPVLRKTQVRSGRQGGAIDRDERATLDISGTGISIGLVAQRPESSKTRARDRQGAGARGGIRIIDEAEVDLVIAGGITAEVQRTRSRAEVGDIAGVREDERGLIIHTTHDVGTIGTVGLDRGASGQSEQAIDRDGRRLRRQEDIDVAVVVVGLGRVAGVEQGAAIEDERAGVSGRAGGVTTTDGRKLADVGERGDSQGAATDDRRTGVVIETGEGLRAAAVLDEGDDAGGLIDQTVEGAAAIAVTKAEDRGGGVGVDDITGAGERADEDTRGGHMGVPSRDGSSGGVKVEGRSLAEIDVRIGPEGRGSSGQLDGALIDVRRTRVSVSPGDDQATVAGLGERTRPARDQGADGQRVSGRRAIGRHDDFRSGSADRARSVDRGRARAIIKEQTARGISEESVQRKSLSASNFERVDGLGTGNRQGRRREIVRRRGESGRRERSIRRERTRGRAADEPVDAAEGGPTADDTVRARRAGREGEGAAVDRREIKGGARRAGTEGTEGQRRAAATGAGDGLHRTLTGRRRQGSEGLGARRGGGAFISQDTTGGVAEGIDVEDDGSSIRQDIEIAGEFAELEHTVGDGGGTGQAVVRGRRDHPGADAHLLQVGQVGDTVVRYDRSDDVVGRVRAAEAEGLRGRARSDRTGHRQGTDTVGDEHRDGTRTRT